MLIDFRLDVRGVKQILRSPEVKALIDSKSQEIADNVKVLVPGGTRIDVQSYTTDRAAGAVTIVDVRGMAWQARDGVLTRAAGFAGLEVKAWQR